MRCHETCGRVSHEPVQILGSVQRAELSDWDRTHGPWKDVHAQIRDFREFVAAQQLPVKEAAK